MSDSDREVSRWLATQRLLIFIATYCLGLMMGARDWEQSLAMARIAVADGITCSIMTPHQLGQYTQTTGEQIRQHVVEFQNRLDAERIPLKVLPGADVRIDSDMVDRLASGDCVTLGDQRKHVLLELPHELYMPLEPVLASLDRLNMIGILSHPERNEGILKRPELLLPLVERGCQMQITADSLCGAFGDGPRTMCEWMLERGLVHFIASDAHGTRRRKPQIRAAFDLAKSLVGESYANAICCENPAAVVAGQKTKPLPAVQRRGWLSRVLSRAA